MRAASKETSRRIAGLIEVVANVHLPALLVIGVMGCGASSRPPSPAPVAVVPSPAAVAPAPPREPDPDLHKPPPRRVLAIDWPKLALGSDADALAVWRQIAPTGADWDDKLEEIPAAVAHPLALAVIRGGNFTCAPPSIDACGRPAYDVPAPAPAAGFDDPCLRRLLALWAFAQLDEDDAPAVRGQLPAIAAIPPPESQLVIAAIHGVPEAAHDARLELIAAAWRAGQREVIESALGALDEPHLVEAVQRHHITPALELIAAADHRALYLAAITDEALAPGARAAAITELVSADDKLAADVHVALVAAAGSKDCQVAAAAARALDHHGDHRFVPRRPRTASPAALMRAMCVLASFEALQGADEPSLLASFLPPRGLERVTITYDALSEVDADGDGDPYTAQTAELVARADAVLPEIEDLARAMRHCTGAICVSDDHEFRFVWKPTGGALLLTRLDVADRPPCTAAKPAAP